MTRTTDPSSSRSRNTSAARHAVRIAAIAAALIAAAGCDSGGADDTDATTPAATDAVAHTGSTRDTIKPPSTTATTTPTTTTPTSTVPAVPRPTGERDELVAVNGTRLHIHCNGEGGTTVMLISGFETSSGSWSAVTPTLEGRTRVCTYDRPGLGVSDPATTIQSFRSQAADLQALLTATGEVGPYLVVGHSFGGAQAIEFASLLGGAIEALVLVDASPVGWPTTLCAISDDGSEAAGFLRGMCDGWADPTANDEHLDVFGAFAEIAEPPSLGSLPVTVLTATSRQLPPDIAEGERSRLDEAWAIGQQRWAALSSNSRITAVADTGHFIQLDRPDVVVDAVEALLP